MKNRQHPLFLSAIGVLAIASISLHAATVQVDIGRSDGGGAASTAPQAGWEGWTIAGSQGAMNTSSAFSYADATDGTVDVTMASPGNTFARNYNNTITGAQSGLQDLLEDMVFFNAGLGAGTPLFIQVQIDDLKAGDYSFTGYHHFVQPNTGFPTTDIILNGGDTGQDIATVQHDSPFLVDTLNTSVVNFTVANDDDAVTIRYEAPASTGTNYHFSLNGFEINQIPEPSAMALLGLGGLALWGRRRK